MIPYFFTQSFLLQAIGWGIINSLWQSAILWLLYKVVTYKNEKYHALFRHHLSLICLLGSLVWFLFTIVSYYFSVTNNQSFPEILITISKNQLPVAFNYLLPLFSAVYLGFLCYYAIQFCKQYFFLLPQTNKQLTKTPVDIRLFTQQAALHIGIKKTVTVWLSKNIDVPSVSGYFKPVILLPFTLLNHLSTAQVEAILLHELAHIKRDDYLINLLQLIAENILFFNPFVMLLGSTIKQEREKCCDDWVLNYKYNQKEYAAALVLIEQHRTKQLTLALAATNGKKNLLSRVQRIFTATPVTYFNFTQQLKLITTSVVIIAGILLLLPALKKPATNSLAMGTKPILSKPLHSNKTANSIAKNSIKKTTNSKVFARSANKNKEKNRSINIEDIQETYPIAMLNEALLNNAEPENTATNIANNETLKPESIFMKVEEENSGAEGKKLYYLQLNIKNGKPEVKPLAYINKQQTTEAKKLAQKKNKLKRKPAAL